MDANAWAGPVSDRRERKKIMAKAKLGFSAALFLLFHFRRNATALLGDMFQGRSNGKTRKIRKRRTFQGAEEETSLTGRREPGRPRRVYRSPEIWRKKDVVNGGGRKA